MRVAASPGLLAAVLAAGVSVASPGASAAAQSAAEATLRVEQIEGRAELSAGSGWQPAHSGAAVSQGLRTGEGGRAWLSSTATGRAGQVLAGPQALLGVSGGEAALRSGQFLLVGPLAVFVLGRHLVLEGRAQARVDLIGGERRIALLAGSGRLALPGRVVLLGSGRQVDLDSGAVTAYAETDLWYAPQLRGVGRATVQATRGPVYLTDDTREIAQVGRTLAPGQRLSTGQGAWAEVGFSGGGYLRLQASSELNVLRSGADTALQLTRGSAWNVSPSRPQGGTALLGSALRGSVFAVSGGGLKQTFGAAPVDRPDVAAAGDLNQNLDAELAQPLTLQVDAVPGRVQRLALNVTVRGVPQGSAPGARVTAQVGTRRYPLSPVAGQAGRFRLDPTDAPLPEGPHTVVVRAEWRGQLRTRTLRFTVDRTPPTLGAVQTQRSGNVLTLRGAVRDEDAGTGRERLTVAVTLGENRFERSVPLRGSAGTFELPLPAPPPGTPVRVTVRDEAGNESDAVLP
ncbi:hypothetical protein [Deinococcus aerophilus]|uniref:FecR protein domain-containing protein n=1 Tax=Deinococcus aerophilus TaxID=522488 RepID=A0ABQ2GHM9_9DEIO|nr:hypothetical protein [Deinococcus aerophilus]GGL95971.1 hypothetical protein GCM10010841_00470 [Deinococcus aerophilus]